MPKHQNKHDKEHLDAKHPATKDVGTEEISKSQRKRDMHALQALGEQLAELPKP